MLARRNVQSTHICRSPPSDWPVNPDFVMKALFVYSIEGGPSLRTPLHHFGQMQYGISYLSAALQGAGIGTRLLVLSSESEKLSLELAAETIRDFDPDVLGFTCVATQFPFIDKVARLARGSWPDKHLIIGGPHVSLNPEEAARSVFDAVCIGEGEYPMLEWLQQLQAGREPEGIQNLWLKRADWVQCSGTGCAALMRTWMPCPFPTPTCGCRGLRIKRAVIPGSYSGSGQSVPLHVLLQPRVEAAGWRKIRSLPKPCQHCAGDPASAGKVSL